MDNNEWREARRDVNRGGRFGLGWVFVILAVIAILGIAVWGFNVATSSIKGQGDAVIQKNSADNWIKAQAFFEEKYQDITVSDKQIGVATAALAAKPEDRTLQTNLTGITNHCLSAVGEYNAEARKFLSEDFRSADLPSEIDQYDTATDCAAQ